MICNKKFHPFVLKWNGNMILISLIIFNICIHIIILSHTIYLYLYLHNHTSIIIGKKYFLNKR